MIRITPIIAYMIAVGVVTNTAEGNHYSYSVATKSSPTTAPIYANNTKAPTLPPIIIPTESPSNPDVIHPPVPPPQTISKAPTALPTTHGNDNNTTRAPISTHTPTASAPPHDLTPHPPTSSPVQVPGPAAAPSNSTPTNAPNPANSTSSPIVVPTPTLTDAPITTHSPTKVPTHPPTASPTAKPAVQPALVPTIAPSQQQRHFSLFKIIAKTVAWLIIILLSVVAFGACMSHRYRIYYYLRSTYYTVTRFLLQLPCTIYILSKLRLSSFSSSNGNNNSNNFDVNTIIFDNDMSEGLLMRENEYD
jgi:hypothetical protein